jgi:HAD superfamily phosphatase
MRAIVVFDIDGVIRDVALSYRRAIADTVEHFTQGQWRPTMADIDRLKGEGIWNNDWEASQELTYRYWENLGQSKNELAIDYESLVRFFQARYRGTNWDGYITTEPLLVEREYFNSLNANAIGWGFFSGATRGSAEYVLKRRLGLEKPVLIAMEDAPGKPNPEGLFAAIAQINDEADLIPTLYVGDTVADMYTAQKAAEVLTNRLWIGVGILPPHILEDVEIASAYEEKLKKAGAAVVLSNVQQLTPARIEQLIKLG